MIDNKESRSNDLAGAVDMHIHSAPDLVTRSGDDLDLAREAAEAGMQAIVLKSHYAPTAGRAYLCNRVMNGAIRVFGGLALNPAVGGLNPVAVDAALKMGARVIWMPTLGARNQRNREGREGGITIFDESGKILDVVVEIVDMIASAGAVLNSGHLAPEETLAHARLAHERHLERFVVGHPEMPRVDMSLDMQREATKLGAFIERDIVHTTRYGNHQPLDRFARDIRAVGVETTVIATDLGQSDTPKPVDGMSSFLKGLRGVGFKDEELKIMVQRNPEYLLGLQR